MMQIKLIVVLMVAGLSATQVIGLAVKGGLEHPPATKGGPLFEAPAAKGRVLERQQQQQRLETIEEPLPKEQLKASQEELQVSQVEEVRASYSKTGARKQEGARKEELATQQKLEDLQQVQLLENNKQYEVKQQQRFEARPQLQQQQEQLVEQQAAPLEQVKLQQVEQQRVDYDKQEIELRLPEEQQRKIPEPLVQQQQVFYQQREEQVQQEQVRSGAEAEPYSFSYNVDGSSRSESGDTKGVVRGQYTLQGADGSRRIVDYIADQDGFRASVNTNEFGTEARSPAGVALRSSQPSAEDITLRLEGKTRESLQATVQQQQQQQQQVVNQYSREVLSGVKGAAAPPPVVFVAAPEPAPAPAQVKGLLQAQLPILQEQEPIPAPVKRPTSELARKEPIIQKEEPIRAQLEESSKSAELVRREPKALKGAEQSRVVKETRSFESATAHREYRAPVQQKQQVLRSQQQPSQVRQQPLRPQYPQSGGQYPPSPVLAAGYRRYPSEQRNPRVSFYSSPSISTEDEQPAGFESRS